MNQWLDLHMRRTSRAPPTILAFERSSASERTYVRICAYAHSTWYTPRYRCAVRGTRYGLSARRKTQSTCHKNHAFIYSLYHSLVYKVLDYSSTLCQRSLSKRGQLPSSGSFSSTVARGGNRGHSSQTPF